MSYSFNNHRGVMASVMAAVAWLAAAVQFQWNRHEHRITSDNAVVRAAQAGTVITVVVIGVVSMVGILIVAQVSEAIPGAVANDSPLNSTLTSVTDGFGSSMEFVPIVMLVLLASVVIAVVQQMRN